MEWLLQEIKSTLKFLLFPSVVLFTEFFCEKNHLLLKEKRKLTSFNSSFLVPSSVLIATVDVDFVLIQLQIILLCVV